MKKLKKKNKLNRNQKYFFSDWIAFIKNIVDASKKKIAWWSTNGVPEVVYANVEKQHVKINDFNFSILRLIKKID